jgi:sugar phosphate isomerase/epimerase/type 1 glutamine amidotransferase
MLHLRNPYQRTAFILGWTVAALPILLAAQESERFERERQEALRRLTSSAELNEEAREAIEAALPKKANATAAGPRKLLIFDVNVGYPGHPSRFHANYAFERMGKETGAFDIVLSRDPQVFRAETLKQFDAVFLNNTVGNLFEDPTLRQNLLEFVYGGGGLMGVHGTTVAFTRWPGAHEDWPEFGIMLGGRGARHREFDERVFTKIDSPAHPLVQAFDPQGFEYRDEFFRVHGPYSRDRVRVLFSIDVEKTDLNPKDSRWQQERDDNDYALAWIRNYGRGRVFYCTIAHNPHVFQDPMMLRFYLDAAQFAVGDLPAPTTPSGRLTPAMRAQEKLGWRLGVTAYSFHRYTLFEAIDKTAELGLTYLGGLSFQKVSPEIGKNFDCELSDEELKQIRLKLDAQGVRLLTHYYAQIPADETGCRRVFEFGRKMGIEAFISEPPVESLDMIERFCDEYDIQLAIHNHDKKGSPVYWHPEKLLEVCQGRSPRVGACPDLGYWIRSGLDPIEGLRTLGNRVLTLQLHDLHELTPDGHDVPWGSGAGRTKEVLREIHRLGIRPTMFGLEYSYDWFDSMPEMAESAAFFNRVSLDLAP